MDSESYLLGLEKLYKHTEHEYHSYQRLYKRDVTVHMHIRLLQPDGSCFAKRPKQSTKWIRSVWITRLG